MYICNPKSNLAAVFDYEDKEPNNMYILPQINIQILKVVEVIVELRNIIPQFI